MVLDEPQYLLLELEFYHLSEWNGVHWTAIVYTHVDDSERLVQRSLEPEQVSNFKLTEARVVEKNASGEIMGFNPTETTEGWSI